MATRFSPVVRAFSKFCGIPHSLHANVWFKDKEELDELVSALVELRDTTDDDFDHVHLQDYKIGASGDVNGAEIIFYRPGRLPDEIECELMEEARNWLQVVVESEKSQPTD
jgi:hypothetical protein